MNRKQLEPREQELISKVLDYRFELGNTIVCLKDVFSKVTLNLDAVPPVYKENFDIGELKCIMNDIKYFSREMGVELEKSNYPEDHPLFERQNYFRLLAGSINNAIENGGVVTTSPLGEYVGKEKKVIPNMGITVKKGSVLYLYLDNIDKASNDKEYFATRESVLVTTFIHEMFHAWIYFTCGENESTVREIEEAMVEFATLFFLKQISQVNIEFEPILRWAERNNRQKQAVIGRLAAYGYGYYLYSMLSKNEQQIVKLFFAYSRNSGMIKPSPRVKHIIIMLYPIYPFEREDEVFENLQQLLLYDYRIRGQVWSSSGKTNIVTKDDSLLLENCVDSITRLDIENGNRNLVLVRDGRLLRIYKEYHGIWSSVFDEDLDEVKTVFYGKHYVILVKRHCDGKSFLISPLDIRRIFDTRYRLVLEDCMSADDFLIDEDGGDKFLYSKANNQYKYVFPFLRLRPISVDVDATGTVIDSKGKRQVPGAYYFTPCDKTFVYLVRDNKSLIYAKDGQKVRELEGYNVFGVTNSDKYAIIEDIKGDGKQNYFSFEKMCVCFDEWFDDCDLPDTVNGEWIFKVKDQGECKILDDTGNDISDKYRDVLEQWIEDSKKGIGSQNR
jgi:hypothetical protein